MKHSLGFYMKPNKILTLCLILIGIIASGNPTQQLTAVEARKLADQASTGDKVAVVISLLPRVMNLAGKDLAYIVESINLGPGRDEALLAGIKLTQSSDVDGDIAALKIAYNSKLDVTLALIAKTPSLSANNLATIAKEASLDLTRDQLLLKGSAYLTDTNLDGVIAMITQAAKEKINVALLIIPKIINVSTTDFGMILKSISDGPTRDALIPPALKLLKVYEGTGAAQIVKNSLNTKVETAHLLMMYIPSATGTDLYNMIAVCGSGITRDLILADGLKIVGKITKAESRALYSKAYDNKEAVAIQIMAKVDEIDGETIGEIAQFSTKGTTRDLIITEGLKRLKKLNAVGLNAMIKAAYKLTERLALEVSSMIEDLNADSAIQIADNITNSALRDRFLIHSVDLISIYILDEPTITRLALAATSQDARDQIVQKGVDKINDSSGDSQ